MAFPIRTTACLVLSLPLALAAQTAPAPAMNYLPPDVVGLACSPTVAVQEPPMPLRVTGGQDSFARRIYGPGDLLTINAGADNGIEVGQEYYVRRVLPVRGERSGPESPRLMIQTTGWIRVYAVDDVMSLATVIHACDTLEVGDYLEPFTLPVVPARAEVRTRPERGNYGLVMRGTDRRRSFANGDFLVVNRGSDHGVTPGMNFVFYRDKRQPENFLFEIGEATAVDVRPGTSTLRVTVARDAIVEGDYVAMRRPDGPSINSPYVPASPRARR